MKRLDQGHLPEHPRQTCPGRSLNLRPLVPQDSTLAKSYCNSLCFCYSETLHPVFPVISDTNRMQYEVGTLANSSKQNIRLCVMLEFLSFLFVLTIYLKLHKLKKNAFSLVTSTIL